MGDCLVDSPGRRTAAALYTSRAESREWAKGEGPLQCRPTLKPQNPLATGSDPKPKS